MRFLEFDLMGVKIPDSIYFFQVDFNGGCGWSCYICLVSMNNKNIKLVKKNKSVVFYKDHEKFKRKIERVEIHSDTFNIEYGSNFLGFYNQDTGMFFKNENYKGVVPIYKIIGDINANLECR